MPQTSFAMLTTLGRSKEAAALANGTTVQITHIAIGDGVTVPSGGETALYHEVARKTISAHGTVVGTANVAYFDAFLAAGDGPYTIREAGLYDDAGDLIAIAHYDPPVNKPVPASGQTIEGTVRLEVAFSDVANVSIVVDAAMQVALQRLTRLPWVPVISMALSVPPATPAAGDTYVIAAGAVGAWTGQAGKLAEYTAAGWAIISPPNGHGVGLPDGRLFVRIGGIYVEYLATDVRAGLVKTATTQEVKDATGTGAVRAQDLVSYILRPDEDEITLYIRPDGDDINDGSANDAGHAFKTIAAAIDRIQNRYAFAGRKAILKLGTAGTYDTCIIRSVAGSLEIVGDKDNRADYVLTGTRGMTISSAAVTLTGLTLTYGNGAIQHNLQVGNSGVATIDGVIFNCAASQSTWSHIFSTDGGSVVLQPGFSATIAGDAYAALYAATGGTIAASTAAEMLITPNNPTFSDATVVARSGGVVELAALTFQPGGGIGRRYHAALNGVINTNGGGANFIPGNSAGLTETGGQYA